MSNLRILIQLLHLAVADRTQLALENAALRHQVAVLKRSVSKPRIEDSDRIFWIMLRRTLRSCRDTLHFVKPDTVVRWHRQGYAHYWKKKSASNLTLPLRDQAARARDFGRTSSSLRFITLQAINASEFFCLRVTRTKSMLQDTFVQDEWILKRALSMIARLLLRSSLPTLLIRLIWLKPARPAASGSPQELERVMVRSHRSIVAIEKRLNLPRAKLGRISAPYGRAIAG